MILTGFNPVIFILLTSHSDNDMCHVNLAAVKVGLINCYIATSLKSTMEVAIQQLISPTLLLQIQILLILLCRLMPTLEIFM